MTPNTMLAARFHAGERGVRLERVPVPEPGPREVLVKVEACGICLSDVHLIDGTLPPIVPVVTPGHEAAGVVAAVGGEVPDLFGIGDPVTLSAGRRCGSCRNCLVGAAVSECLDVQIMGAAYDGAWADYVVVDFVQLVPMPAGLSFEEAAVLTDAVSTPYAALKDTARLRVAESIGIWGLGGLGTHAVQLARIMGAGTIVAIDVNPAARERALRLGADAALDPADAGLGAEILELTGGDGLDVAADFVGVNPVRAQALASLGRNGRLVLVGLTRDPVHFEDSLPIIMRTQTVRGHLGGHIGHLKELVGLTSRGRLDVSGSVSRVYPLDAVEEAIDVLERKEGNPVRIVITPA